MTICKIGVLFLLVLGAVAVSDFLKGTPDPLTVEERSWLLSHPVIRLAPDPDFPPVESFDANGAYNGITRDYLALLEKKLGIRFEIVRLRNWDEIISNAKKREIDLYIASSTPQRAEYMLFTKPFLEFPVVMIARGTHKPPLTLDRLGKMKVSVVSQYAVHDFLRSYSPPLHLDTVPDVRTGLRKVSFGLTDVFVENLATATYFIEKEGVTNLKVAGESGYFYKMGFCSRKDWPELNRILEKGVAAVRADEKRAILKKWIPVETTSLFSDSEFRRRLATAVGALLIIVAGIAAWNRVLARQVRLRTKELEKELAERSRAERELREAREDLEKRVLERTTEVRHANGLLEREIAVRKRTENVNVARLRLLQVAGTYSLDDLLEATLDEAEALTGSLIGFFHFLEGDEERVSLQMWSARTKAEYCKAEGKGEHYDLSAAGVWADCIRQRRPVIHNDYATLPGRKGMPKEHAEVVRELVIPVFRNDRIVAILGVGNKPAEYTSEDVDVVSSLADLAWEITERKRMEEELLMSQFCIDKASIGIYCTDKNTSIFSVNDYACVALGYTKDELCGMTVFDIDPEVTPEKIQELREVLYGSGLVTHETVHRRKDGTTFPVEITASSLDFRGKKFVISFAKDITERKRAEEALKEKEARLKISMELARLAQWDYDVPTGMFTFDEEFYSLYGTSRAREGVTRMSPHEYARRFIPADERSVVAGGIAEVLSLSSNQLEHRIVRADGEERHVVVRGEAVRDEAGTVVKIRGANQDITERKRMEEALRESREKYQAIVDSFDGLIYICSQDYRLEFMNRKLIERTGYDASGELCYKVMHDRDSSCPWCVNEHVFSGETIHWDMYSPKDNCWYEVLNIPIRHADGSMSKHGMMINITDRKRSEDELKQQKQLLQELNETLEKRVAEEVAENREKDIMLIQQNRQAALGEMLDHIAHQWKQPLNSISLLMALLAKVSSDNELTDEEVQSTVEKTDALLQHMAQTIEVFRGFYSQDKEKVLFRIKDPIDQALAFIAPAYRFQAIAVEVDVDAGLTAFGYPKEYTQVLLNILANARDVFRQRRTEKPRVIVRAYAEGTRNIVTIADNAGGITKGIMERIFDFYFTTNESSGGTGIGLYMSKNIVEKNMGGTLDAENTADGARFRIELPTT